MVTFHIDLSEIGTYLSILLRISLVLFMLPIFSSRQVPQTIKALTVLALTTLLYLTLNQTIAPLPFDAGSLLRIAVGEIIFGTIIALAVLLVFAAFQLAGELISFQMGFSFAQVVDPQSGAQTTILSQWFQLFATLIFFSVNGHHIFLRAIVESFRTVPIGGFVLTSDTYQKVLFMSGQLFVIGVKIAAPVMIVLFLTQVGMGLISRLAPEVNILIVSFPVTIVLGFLFIGLSVSVWGNSIEHYFEMSFQLLQSLMGG